MTPPLPPPPLLLAGAWVKSPYQMRLQPVLIWPPSGNGIGRPWIEVCTRSEVNGACVCLAPNRPAKNRPMAAHQHEKKRGDRRGIASRPCRPFPSTTILSSLEA